MIDPTELFLVCVLPRLRDLEIARLLGWYRIPLHTAPKVIVVDRLAFYQPRAWEEYSKLQLGGLEGSPEPILARARGRLTFLYTTGEYLARACTLNDLVVSADERAETSQAYPAGLPEADAPPEVLAALLGNK